MEGQLSDFSMLFELGATLNLAYVAVEYTASYTVALAKNVFGLYDHISLKLSNCSAHIDKETIKSLKPHDVDGVNTNSEIVRIKIKSHQLESKIKTLEKDLRMQVGDMCKSPCFSCLCLYIFLFCLTSGFVMPYDTTEVRFFWIAFSALSIVYSFLAFVVGEIYDRFKGVFQSFVATGFIFAAMAMSAALILLFASEWKDDIVDEFWMQARFISALYPFLFFVCLIFALRHRSSEIREHINGECGRLEEACRALADDVRNHAGFDKFSTKMSDTPTGKELSIIIENKSQVKEVKRGNHKRGRKPRTGKRDRPNN